MNNLILYLIFFIIGIFSINFIKSMCNCNIIEGQGTSSSCPDACTTISTRCATAQTVNDNITKINSKIDNMNYLEREGARELINASGYSDIQSNLSTIIDFCKTAKNACTEMTNIENIINDAKKVVGI